MIPVRKTTPPQELVELKKKAKQRNLTPREAYNTLHNPLKSRVLTQLIEEQGHLCAYCMCSIPRSDVAPQITPITIEHYIPETINSIIYTLDGRISAMDDDVIYDIENVLNLNSTKSPLVLGRKKVLSELINDMNLVLQEGENALLTYCKDRLNQFKNETGTKTEYVGILIWYLKSMIEGLERDEM